MLLIFDKEPLITFKAIVRLSTPYFLTYLNLTKIKNGKLSPFTHTSLQLAPSALNGVEHSLNLKKK